MKLNKQQLFARLGDVDDAYIDESALPEEPIAIPPKRRHAIASFFEKPAVVAAICAIVAFGTVAGIIAAGFHANQMPPATADSDAETISPEEMLAYLEFKSNRDGTCSAGVKSAPENGKLVVPATSPEGDIVTDFFGSGWMYMTVSSWDGIVPIPMEGLTSLHLPHTVTTIHLEGLWGAPLKELTVDADNPVYYAENNCLILRESRSLIYACHNAYIFPEGVVHIAENAFRGDKADPDTPVPMYLPASLTRIDHVGHKDSVCPLSEISVHPDNPVYYAEGGCLVERSTQTAVLGAVNCSIPEGVVAAKSGIFTFSWTVHNLHIPSTLTDFDVFFGYKSKLTTITSTLEGPPSGFVTVPFFSEAPPVYYAKDNCLYRCDPVMSPGLSLSLSLNGSNAWVYRDQALVLTRNPPDRIEGVSSVEVWGVNLLDYDGETPKTLTIDALKNDLTVHLAAFDGFGNTHLVLRSEKSVILNDSFIFDGTELVIDADRLVISRGGDLSVYYCTSITLPADILVRKDGLIGEAQAHEITVSCHGPLSEIHYGGTAEQWAHHSQFFDFTSCEKTVTVYCADGTEIVAWEPQTTESK
ncbi:MAG: hypothetical protein J6D87_05390 [Clostridia bacterium]|nr:hypothetical protein [Clostridia bacterium]